VIGGKQWGVHWSQPQVPHSCDKLLRRSSSLLFGVSFDYGFRWSYSTTNIEWRSYIHTPRSARKSKAKNGTFILLLPQLDNLNDVELE